MIELTDTRKGCLGAILFFFICTGWSYWQVYQQHQFAPTIADTMKKFPGARLVSSFKSGQLVNPASWFWMPATRLVYAAPDTSLPEGKRFFLMTFDIDDENAPTIRLVDVDCKRPSYTYYFPVMNGAVIRNELAMDAVGKPVTAPNGSVFELHEGSVVPERNQVNALCHTNWTKEREAIGRN